MAKTTDNTFIEIFDETTDTTIYKIQFDYGTRRINIKKGEKIALDFVHGGFEHTFTRVGNDLIIGDNTYTVMMEPLGVGHGKEVWNVIKNEDSSYTININKYSWGGSQVGYLSTPRTTETIIMTEDELTEFQTEQKISLNTGENTLYTTWPVLPNPIIHYHMEDHGFYAPANGKLILTNYFLYGENTVFVGDNLLSDIIKNSKNFESIFNKSSKKAYNIYDTFLSENLYGGDKADKIHSYMGDDTIEGGKGNDKIYLGEGNKTVVISQGDGKDTVYNFMKADSVEFNVDTDDVFFTKSSNNLIINRRYDDVTTEQTVIKNYFKNFDKGNKIIISNGDSILVDDLTESLINGDICLKPTGTKTIKGTDLSDEAYSSEKNETFVLKKGNDIIHFKNDGIYSWAPYKFGNDTVKLTKGAHLTLDLNEIGGSLSFERKGNNAIITARYKIEIAGRDNGKEEWLIKKTGKDSYTITKTTYHFTGNGYATYGDITTETMTKEELQDFQTKHNVTLKTGNNTLYTSWAVVPDPEIHYSMKDGANWGILLGTITLKNYFKYGEDSVYIGNTSLQDYFRDETFIIDKTKSKTSQTIRDTIFNDVIRGSKKFDRIFSVKGDDTITAGKCDDKITLGEGNKTVYINKGDGKDTLIITEDNTSTNIIFDENVDGINFDKSGQNLVINRHYGEKTEQTIIKDYYKYNLESNIKISVGDSVIFNELGEYITDQRWEITCKNPPAETPETYQPESVCAMICSYSAYNCIENVPVNELNQTISSWQANNTSTITDNYIPEQNNDIMPVIVQN